MNHDDQLLLMVLLDKVISSAHQNYCTHGNYKVNIKYKFSKMEIDQLDKIYYEISQNFINKRKKDMS